MPDLDNITAAATTVAPAPASAPAPTPPPARPDAVLVPRLYPRGKAGDERGEALKREFAPLLGVKRVHIRHSGVFETLITPFDTDRAGDRNHRYWPKSHPLAGEEFYDWADRGDGVLVGSLTPDAKAYINDSQAQA